MNPSFLHRNLERLPDDKLLACFVVSSHHIRMIDDHDQRSEARIIPLGEPIEGGSAIFEGSLIETHRFIAEMSAEERREVAIWTVGHIFTADEFAVELPGHEHDPLPANP